MEELFQHYAVREFDPLVEAVIKAKAGVDLALERWERAIAALAGVYQDVEAKRETQYEAAEQLDGPMPTA